MVKKFVEEVLYQATRRLRRWITQPTFVIDASFPQRYADELIKDVLHNDVPQCKGSLFALMGDDSVIQVSASMPQPGEFPKGKVFIYNDPRAQHSHGGFQPVIDDGKAYFPGPGVVNLAYPDGAPRAVASQEILQNLGPGNDSDAIAKTIFRSRLQSLIDEGVDRPTKDDGDLLKYLYSREPGTQWPDIRP